MRFKATVNVKLRASVSDAPGNAVMNNTQRVAPSLKSNLPLFINIKQMCLLVEKKNIS